ncbi:nitroreductase [Companilactobacillus allii]|uniref:Nitroreductase domain-containing protein n=1 Tax=Companilactobacillus allii TaxID=1847728 RepID=A0A1P8Q2H3_9LACO|nr:nitroreductase [Companilactobacillus allii]APX72026.1 hypothetical protein BTM29_05380 [Companilactobacillus allii]USQ69119.1 nitroreductase [Companilactobacillus allii]
MGKNLIYKRRSIRSFDDEEVSDSLIEEIIKDASHAPSWQNAQPWHVYVAKDGVLDRIKAEYKNAKKNNLPSNTDITTPHRDNRSDLSMKNIEEWGDSVKEALGDQGTDLPEFQEARADLFHAPAVAYLTAKKNASEFTIYDIGSFGQTLMLSATSWGIGTIPAYALVTYPDILKKELLIPDDEEVVIGIAMGYPDDSKLNCIKTTRTDVDNILDIRK